MTLLSNVSVSTRRLLLSAGAFLLLVGTTVQAQDCDRLDLREESAETLIEGYMPGNRPEFPGTPFEQRVCSEREIASRGLSAYPAVVRHLSASPSTVDAETSQRLWRIVEGWRNSSDTALRAAAHGFLDTEISDVQHTGGFENLREITVFYRSGRFAEYQINIAGQSVARYNSLLANFLRQECGEEMLTRAPPIIGTFRDLAMFPDRYPWARRAFAAARVDNPWELRLQSSEPPPSAPEAPPRLFNDIPAQPPEPIPAPTELKGQKTVESQVTNTRKW